MFRPMLAGKTPEDLSELSYPVLVSPKLDGIRCIVIDGVAYSRKMKPIPNKKVQELVSDYINSWDGELMLDKGDFNDIQSVVMKPDADIDGLRYFIFDSIQDNMGFLERLSNVDTFFLIPRAFEVQTPYTQANNAADLLTLLDHYLACGYEGAMIRSFDGLYKQGRSTTNEGYLLKLKTFQDAEATIKGCTEKLTNTNPKELDELGYTKRSTKQIGKVPTGVLGALEVITEDGVEFSIGSGFNDDMRQQFWEERDSLVGKTITFTYQELSKYGVPRFPIFKGFRYD